MTRDRRPFTRRAGAPSVFGRGDRLRFLGPGGWPLVFDCVAPSALGRLRAAARRAGVEWLHGVALLRRVEGGLALVGAEGPRAPQILRLRPDAEGVDVEAVRGAARSLLDAGEGPAAAVREAFVGGLAAAGVELPPRGARDLWAPGTGRRLRARARALSEDVQAVGDDHATEWLPRFASAFRADPAHLWLRPALGFRAEGTGSEQPGVDPERDFCTTHPTPAEVGVLALPDEWGTAVRVVGGRRRLRVGLLLHPLGTTLVLLEPDGTDLVVVVHRGDRVRWSLYDRTDYRAAFLSRRRPPPKDGAWLR